MSYTMKPKYTNNRHNKFHLQGDIALDSVWLTEKTSQ